MLFSLERGQLLRIFHVQSLANIIFPFESKLLKNGCGSKIGTQNGTLVNGSMDKPAVPGGVILTHTQMMFLKRHKVLVACWQELVLGEPRTRKK